MRSAKALIVFLLWALYSQAQPEVVNRSSYPFVRFNQNVIYQSDSAVLGPLYRKLERLMTVGDEQIQIVHIGDSHIQADLFSGRVRQRLQEYFPGGNGGRGFVFPYTMAHTNNPFNYKVSYTGTWTGCRNVEASKDCLLGLAGISVSTTDSQSSFTISSTTANGLQYEYTRIRVFFQAEPDSFQVELTNAAKNEQVHLDSGSTVVEWELLEPATNIEVKISRLCQGKKTFSLMGVSLDTDDPGIIYNSIGVNGAQVTSFLKCQLFEEQLSQLHPDVIILSLGTNDAYGADFVPADFARNYQKLIDRIKSRNPSAAIILTTPGDCYRYRKYPNKYNSQAREVIFNLADKNKLDVWDFYTVMGGLGSMQKWYTNGLSAADKIHLTQKGYELQGDLLFEALAQSFDNYIGETNK